MEKVYGLFAVATDEFSKEDGVFRTKEAAKAFLEQEKPDYLGDLYVDEMPLR